MKNVLSIGLLVAGLFASPAFAAVDLNTATQSELESVKGLGPAKAQAIISYRKEHGKFKNVDELDNVKGFGSASVAKLKGELTVGPEKAGK
ncbi:ComEA family DNA-binding protein [Thiobacillus sedimenti]|uniref:Helix-hairpin-helix domain-containing protein n=1 Tax=Thiobacillus sedimenti TaxID=3110231 RepID=A0ABZ1CJ26_9PROT|nr:helix-hairpin-helix domain-containing protein [Thiobacillus sp. SCUT-2]WRS38307.1 helix-hairpin-helix domain-containing protein [Thiobacillus sp. SCUT-2]